MTDQEYANREQEYGPLYPHSDYKPGERITYRAYTGEIRTGEILWVQEPGTTVKLHIPLKAQYVVAPDQDTGMPDFVNLGDVQSSVER